MFFRGAESGNQSGSGLFENRLLPGREEDRVSQNSICEIKLARIRTVSQLQPSRMPINQDHQYEAMFFTVRMA